MIRRNFERTLPCKLSQEELNELSDRVSQITVDLLPQLEGKKVKQAKEVNEEIKGLSAEVQAICKKIKDKSEDRVIECFEQYNNETGLVEIHRWDYYSGDNAIEDFLDSPVIETRLLTDEDRQQIFAFDLEKPLEFDPLNCNDSLPSGSQTLSSGSALPSGCQTLSSESNQPLPDVKIYSDPVTVSTEAVEEAETIMSDYQSNYNEYEESHVVVSDESQVEEEITDKDFEGIDTAEGSIGDIENEMDDKFEEQVNV